MLLQAEFPEVAFVELGGYNIAYAKSKRKFAWKILLQVPKIFRAIRSEKQWLQQQIKSLNPDIVISDNRYGFRHPGAYNVFITHQLQLQMPLKIMSGFARAVVYSFLRRFNEVWIPDYEGKHNLAGSLSHPKKMPPVNCFYIGLLNRFVAVNPAAETSNRLLFLISGPEPQRTALEEKLTQAAQYLNHEILMVCGQPSELPQTKILNNLVRKNHLPQHELLSEIEKAEAVVARSGYTTVMELFALNKKALLIPTPGQTEQEYLAKHLVKMNWFHTASQQQSASEIAASIKHMMTAKTEMRNEFESLDLEKFLNDFLNRVSDQKRQ